MTHNPDEFRCIEHVAHILQRPDTYIGDVGVVTQSLLIYNPETLIMKRKTIDTSSGMCKALLLEPLSNATDNYLKSMQTNTPCTTIKITVDMKTGETSIWNDGLGIPVVEKDGEYIPSMVFGKLLSSNNFNDKKDRNWGGRNGYGIKLCNIFSKKFSVHGYDPVRKLSFKQTWENNMKMSHACKVASYKGKATKKGFYHVTWTPDFDQFDIKMYNQDILHLYCKYALDAALVCPTARVYFNKKRIAVKRLFDYAQLFQSLPIKKHLSIATKSSRVLLFPSKNPRIISFASNIETPTGGTHVQAWVNAILQPLAKKLTSATRVVKIPLLKRHFSMYIVERVINPAFDSQTKTKLVTKIKPKQIDPKWVEKMNKWPIISIIKSQIDARASVVAPTKRRRICAGLDHANKCGGKYSSECTMMIVEGKSAKTYAVQGMSIGMFGKKGRNWFGVYPLTGKFLNMRKNPHLVSNNKIVSDIIHILGLKQNVDYAQDIEFNKLKYGRIVILADADSDGIHIASLVLNMFHYMYPTLISRKFIYLMHTPIARVLSNNRLFYCQDEFDAFISANPTSKCKYYKGLGSSSKKEVIETFGKKLILLQDYKQSDQIIHELFCKKASARKERIKQYVDDKKGHNIQWNTTGHEIQTMSIGSYLMMELPKATIAINDRTMPRLVDGLKSGSRKIVFGAISRGLFHNKPELKVTQLSGYVAERTLYHHGEGGLDNTIKHLAQDFIGSNNIPLFQQDGQFGTRIANGADAASGRYISTRLESIVRYIFRPEDDDILDYVVDSGVQVEPVEYAPIIPFVLCNGTIGIGSCWSTFIPNYNPLDLIQSTLHWINGQPLPTLVPWYRGFTGTIVAVDATQTKFTTSGCMEQSKFYLHVTELPIGLSIDQFISKLHRLVGLKKIKRFENNSTDITIDIKIKELPDKKCTLKSLGLTTSLNMTNMVLLHHKQIPTEFKSIHDIINEYCTSRLMYYNKRLRYIKDKLHHDYTLQCSKRLFISHIIEKKIMFTFPDGTFKTSQQVATQLSTLDFKKIKNSFSYLTSLPFTCMNKKNVLQLDSKIKTIQQEIKKMENTTARIIWKKELMELKIKTCAI